MHLPGFSKRVRTADTVVPRSGRLALPERDTIIGQKALGRYEIVQLIGEGSNGEVYLARTAGQQHQYVVVKRVKTQLLANPKFRQFFDSEVRSMTRFSHPYAVQLYDASLDDPIGPCLVLEYIHGITLEAILRHYGRLGVEHAARLLGQFCHALQAAHDAGIMHRDLKPANVMVVNLGTPDEALKVMDFGFAGFTEKPHVQLCELTGHGPIFACGTPAYVSPEMIRGDAVDVRADIYSVGVMAYEMLTGRLPFEFETVEEIMAGHVRAAPPRFAKVGAAGVPPTVETVVTHALAKFPNERQQSARAFAEHLGRALGVDVWGETAPPGYEPPPAPAEPAAAEPVLLAPAVTQSTERFLVYDRFEAMLSPRMAAAKLRGFADDVGGEFIESEPGVIRMRIALPSGYAEPVTRSALFSWINAVRKPSVARGHEPIEVNMQMQKLTPDRVAVLVSFQPLKEFPPPDVRQWKERCEGLNHMLRMYLMASSPNADPYA
jgi:tRNA A-37 threonylcarbamoyl transferase component Bud32